MAPLGPGQHTPTRPLSTTLALTSLCPYPYLFFFFSHCCHLSFSLLVSSSVIHSLRSQSQQRPLAFTITYKALFLAYFTWVKCHIALSATQFKSNQIKFYLYSTFMNDFWSSQSAVQIVKIPYSKDILQLIQQHSLFRISV